MIGPACYCYGPPTKLREGNIFISVCLFRGRGYLYRTPSSLHTGSHGTGPWPWHPRKCSNVFNLDFPVQGSTPRHIQTCSTWMSLYRALVLLTPPILSNVFTVKHALSESGRFGIRLKCLLVFFMNLQKFSGIPCIPLNFISEKLLVLM